MRSTRGLLFATAAIACIVAGLFLANGTFVALSLPIVIYLAILSLSLDETEAKLDIQRKLSNSRIMAGDTIEVDIIVRNTGPKIELVEIVDNLPAYVVLKEGHTATSEEIIKFCKDNLVKYKVPRKVLFTDTIPTNIAGKKLRRVLREETPEGPKKEG